MDRDKLQQRLLQALARVHGIATSYIDYRKQRVVIRPEIICGLISAIGDLKVNATTPPETLVEMLQRVKARTTEKLAHTTFVAWDGKFPSSWTWQQDGATRLFFSLTADATNQGAGCEGEMNITRVPLRSRSIRGQVYHRVRLQWDKEIPFGYYRLIIRDDLGRRVESLLISAPRRLEPLSPRWGVFAPIYALKSDRAPAIGDYTSLLEAGELIKKNGGAFFGTLPLLPLAYEGKEPEISPYSPVSRLFWNEIYLDVAKLPGANPASMPEDTGSREVDYDAVYAAKKKIVMQAAEEFFKRHPEGDDGYRRHLADHPHLDAYADFRAGQGSDHQREKQFHLYAQYACHLQLLEIKEAAETGRSAQLYLDYTVGVDPDGFDAQALQDQFLKGYHIGAPPDLLFSKGQNWGLEPLHPVRLADSRYSYMRNCLHHYLQYAQIVRLDHIMGLSRIYCVPEGCEAHEGTYVYYDLESQIAVLCLEAWRHDAVIIGEDLGTVTQSLQDSMDDHELSRMWVAQFNMKPEMDEMFDSIIPPMIACINTHDMMPLAAYLNGDDTRHLLKLELIDKDKSEEMLEERKDLVKNFGDYPETFLAIIEGMEKSPARLVMVNIEDVWGETKPQNMPGTVEEYPNWRLKLAHKTADWPDQALFRPMTDILNRTRKVQK